MRKGTCVTLIPQQIFPAALRDRSTGEISTENNDLWNEAILDAIIEHLLQPAKC